MTQHSADAYGSTRLAAAAIEDVSLSLVMLWVILRLLLGERTPTSGRSQGLLRCLDATLPAMLPGYVAWLRCLLPCLARLTVPSPSLPLSFLVAVVPCWAAFTQHTVMDHELLPPWLWGRHRQQQQRHPGYAAAAGVDVEAGQARQPAAAAAAPAVPMVPILRLQVA